MAIRCPECKELVEHVCKTDNMINHNQHPHRILILGMEGYLGRALAGYLQEKGHYVSGVDNGLRQKNVALIGSNSLFSLGRVACDHHFDILDFDKLKARIEEFAPDTIVHLAEQPSAPFSFLNAHQSTYTQHNNVIGTLNVLWAIKEVNPNIHLIKLGTAGEYADWLYKGITVPEQPRINVNYQGVDWQIPTPRYSGSWYHWSKIYDSYNIDYACRIWGLRASDLNQGIVYGHLYDTRFDYDYYFGTCLNRFLVQALKKIPLTIYGPGNQERGFIFLQNSLEAMEIVMNNPPSDGEYRIVHQLTETRTINQIAELVTKVTGFQQIDHINNPRVEMPENKFTFEARFLKDFGLKAASMETEVPALYEKIKMHSHDVCIKAIQPTTNWK